MTGDRNARFARNGLKRTYNRAKNKAKTDAAARIPHPDIPRSLLKIGSAKHAARMVTTIK